MDEDEDIELRISPNKTAVQIVEVDKQMMSLELENPSEKSCNFEKGISELTLKRVTFSNDPSKPTLPPQRKPSARSCSQIESESYDS